MGTTIRRLLRFLLAGLLGSGFILFISIALFIYFAQPAAAATNLIYNPSAEITSPGNTTLPDQWIKGKWGTNTASFTYPVTSGDGSKAVRTTISSYVSGDAKWAWTPVNVTPGRIYTYSDQYVATVPTTLTIEYTKTDGTLTHLTVKTIPASASWTTSSHTFTIPANITKIRVFHLIKQNGTLTIDNVSLTDVTPSSNLISNSAFESVETSGMPTNWSKGGWGTNTRTFSFPVGGRNGNGASIAVTSYTSGDAKWVFTNVPVTPGVSYQFSDYYKSNATTFVTVQFKKSDGTFSYLDLGSAPSAANWTSFQKSFGVPPGVVSLTVFHLLKSTGTLSVDEYRLIETAGDPSKFDKGYVSLNFDDGYLSTYQNAIPILDAKGYKSDQYIVTNYVLGGFPAYVSQAQVLDMQQKGHIIGAHTKSHPDLTTLSTAEATNEISGSRNDLIAMGATPVNSFAYPFGAYNASVQQLVRNAGFIAGRSSDGGQNDKNTSLWALRRFPMENTTTFAQVKAEIDTAVANKTWLILLFHEVSTNGARYAVTPALLQQIVNYLAQINMPPITVSQGVQKMQQ